MIIQRINIHTKYLKMRNRIFCIFILLFPILRPIASGQDIYDLEHSKVYADFLFSSNQFKLAAEEYERLVFMDPKNPDYKIKLTSSYRKAANYSYGIKRVYELSGGEINKIDKGLSIEYLTMLIYTDSLDKANGFLKSNAVIGRDNNLVFRSCNLLLSQNYKEAGKFVEIAKNENTEFPSQIFELAKSSEKIKFKNPVVAATFSAIIPGTGKVYTGDYADGLVSLLFVASNAWQSYKGFEKNGLNSISGWIFGGVTLGFYIGNIYGSAKSAKKHNKLKKDAVKNQVYEFLEYYSF